MIQYFVSVSGRGPGCNQQLLSSYSVLNVGSGRASAESSRRRISSWA